jgi:putative NADPH-quinone reductase
MKTVAIVAGPRKECATDMIADTILKGAKDWGGEGEKIYLYDLDIKPCTGCLACEKTSTCPIQDDHQSVLDAMDTADTVIFASPTYWSNVTSVAKMFMDRSIRFFTQTTLGPKRLAEKPSKIVLVTSCGAPFPFSNLFGVIPGSVRAMKVFFQRMKVKIKIFAVPGMLHPDSKPDAKTLKKAYRLGTHINR